MVVALGSNASSFATIAGPQATFMAFTNTRVLIELLRLQEIRGAGGTAQEALSCGG
jgi:hypothetical protein